MSSKDVEKRRAATQEERDIGEEHVDGYNVPMPYVPMAQYRAPPFSDIDETTEPPSRSSTVATGYRAISTSIPKVKETFGKMLPLWNKSRLASSSVGGGGEAPGISRTMLLAARDDPVEDPCELSSGNVASGSLTWVAARSSCSRTDLVTTADKRQCWRLQILAGVA